MLAAPAAPAAPATAATATALALALVAAASLAPITVALAMLAVWPVVNTLGVSTGGLPPARSAAGGAMAASSSGHLPTR